MWGTLLGAIREGGLMAHDYDIDIGLLPADYARRDAFIGALIARGYLYVEDWRYKFRLLRRDHLLHIDFELFYPDGDRMICLAGTEHDGYFGGAVSGRPLRSAPAPLTHPRWARRRWSPPTPRRCSPPSMVRAGAYPTRTTRAAPISATA